MITSNVKAAVPLDRRLHKRPVKMLDITLSAENSNIVNCCQ